MMLIKHSVTNFQSFLDKVEVSWIQNNQVPESDWVARDNDGAKLSKVMAVLGHNASGKTALLKSMVFLHWFVCGSFLSLKPDEKIPLSPHFLAQDIPSEFEALFIYNGQILKYELKCNTDRVLYESLHRKKERFGYVFVREWEESTKTYTIKQKDFGMSGSRAEEACNLRQNASFISIAAQHGVPYAIELASINVRSNIVWNGKLNLSREHIYEAAEDYSQEKLQSDWMRNLLKSWDLGLNNIEINEINIQDNEGNAIKKWIPFGVHDVRGGIYRLPLTQESNGTQSAFVLLWRILPVLLNGGLAIIDEFEGDLHPHMLEPILDLFANPKTNPKNAQIFFTCHVPEILNLIPKSQVILVEKENGVSDAWRMDDIKGIRADDNFYAKYMSGVYGAVPNI